MRATRRYARAGQYRRPGGPWDVPALDQLLGAAPERADAVIDGEIRLSSGDVDRLTGATAAAMRAAGVRRGDAVVWQLPNGYRAVVLYRACWRLGAVAVPIHHQAGPADLGRLLPQIEPALLVAPTGTALGDRPGATAPELVVPTAGAPVAARPTPATDIRSSPPRPSDPAVVLFTAGSSGSPKAVLHTHRTLACKAVQMPTVHGLGAQDAALMPAPLAHVSGLLNGILVPTVAGMKTVLMARWSAADALGLIEREAVTFMVGPPTFFVGIMGEPGFSPTRVRTLRVVSSGGAGVTSSFARRAAAELGAQVKRSYGSTEAPTVTTSRPGDSADTATTTEGRALGEAELRIVDPATGRRRPDGVEGELWVRGPEVCAGYLDPDLTAEAFARGGWFRTGDLATVDVDSRLRITGRLKDVIIRGGENISVSAVEELLSAHPAVREAAVVGEFDERLGERVAAFVVAPGGFDLETCRAWFTASGAARFTTPERVIVVDRLPTLAAGKVDRAALAARLRTSSSA